MTARNLLLQIVPPPRRDVNWQAAIPLLAFLAVFAGICLYLELSGQLLFANLYARCDIV